MRSDRARFWFSLVLVFLSAVAAADTPTADPLPRAQPEEVGLSSERLKQLTRAQEYVDDGKLARQRLSWWRGAGKLVYLQAFGQRDREAKFAMQTDSIFRIASQTKALVSVGIMMLVEQGKLLLNDPLSKYIPEFKETTVAVPKEQAAATTS